MDEQQQLISDLKTLQSTKDILSPAQVEAMEKALMAKMSAQKLIGVPIGGNWGASRASGSISYHMLGGGRGA